MVSWFGNMAGTSIFVGLMVASNTFAGKADWTLLLAAKKVHGGFGPCFVAGVLCNWCAAAAGAVAATSGRAARGARHGRTRTGGGPVCGPEAAVSVQRRRPPSGPAEPCPGSCCRLPRQSSKPRPPPLCRLVCIATWQANAAQDMTGKFVAIW